MLCKISIEMSKTTFHNSRSIFAQVYYFFNVKSSLISIWKGTEQKTNYELYYENYETMTESKIDNNFVLILYRQTDRQTDRQIDR